MEKRTERLEGSSEPVPDGKARGKVTGVTSILCFVFVRGKLVSGRGWPHEYFISGDTDTHEKVILK